MADIQPLIKAKGKGAAKPKKTPDKPFQVGDNVIGFWDGMKPKDQSIRSRHPELFEALKVAINMSRSPNFGS